MATPQLATLRQWLEDNGGQLHAGIALDSSQQAGVHLRAILDLAPETRICTVPNALALSSLNALVDDDFTVFRHRGLPVEGIGYFYLMYQYIRKEQSFWKPYLDTLPGPDVDHGTPVWFDEPDTQWLAETDVLHTSHVRLENYQNIYNQGIAALQGANIDTEPYTWHLFKWAITMYSSRSFSSQALRPQDSKYWTAYKYDNHGRRQTALLDMSNASAEELDFPVLFPVADIPNHGYDTKVQWTFDSGRFSIDVKDGISFGSEVFNNYGPKSNDELLLGYGFCVQDNPFDKVLLRLRPPPEDLQRDLRNVQAGYFTSDGEWNSEKATFALQKLESKPGAEHEVLNRLPDPLLELMIYMLRQERGLPFKFVENPLDFIMGSNGAGLQYRPHIARLIVESTLPKLTRLNSTTPTEPPQNLKQHYAQIYRGSQLSILQSVTGALRDYLRSLVKWDKPPIAGPNATPMIVTMEGLSALLATRNQQHSIDFIAGIEANAGSRDLDILRDAGWEDDMFVLLLCFVYSCCEFDADSYPEYLLHPSEGRSYEELEYTQDELEQAASAMEIVSTAREACPGSFWADRRWSAKFVAGLGGRVFRYECFTMMLPTSSEGGDARLVIYLYPKAA
ncbi:hypothetical protein M409DRAFT_68568 [Zasmidium cellare ATCC 36951]|uniref:SET domain-containing protein n=1 Tax=Zasmidium cellare ATCC 36951 TaxID=1080233 RepID=A0A6A6C8B2_ZASCE|nr:uncharacterized protein M409DRAFT_68568 [Zasmidium cellare ATCC 36951]KAF2163275.1 hypothetical protein M409DRAFT_68568 [Zasmidium cellare ATCC 36951]